MFITSCNLRKRIGMGRLLQADGGAGIAGEGNPSGDEGDPEAGEGIGEEPKTFTQEELDKIVKERVARAKKDQPSKALTNAEKARVAAEERALLAETKVTCLSKGVASTSVDDVVILAKSMLNDDLTMEQAIDKVLEKYPSFKGEQQKQEQNKNGFIIGANNTKQKVNPNDAIARAFGIK